MLLLPAAGGLGSCWIWSPVGARSKCISQTPLYKCHSSLTVQAPHILCLHDKPDLAIPSSLLSSSVLCSFAIVGQVALGIKLHEIPAPVPWQTTEGGSQLEWCGCGVAPAVHCVRHLSFILFIQSAYKTERPHSEYLFSREQLNTK